MSVQRKRSDAGALTAAIADLLSDRERLAGMGERARSLAVPDAARRLADLFFEAEAAGGAA